MNSYLSGPGKASENLKFSNDEARYLTGGREMTIEALTEIFPDDTYYYNFDTPIKITIRGSMNDVTVRDGVEYVADVHGSMNDIREK